MTKARKVERTVYVPVTHWWVDLDAAAAYAWLVWKGEAKFPGISKSRLKFVSAGQFLEDELSEDGTLTRYVHIDTGGDEALKKKAQFEHPHNSKARFSSAEAVYIYLSVQDDVWHELIRRIAKNDLRGIPLSTANGLDFFTKANVLNDLNWVDPIKDPEAAQEAMQRVMDALVEELRYYYHHFEMVKKAEKDCQRNLRFTSVEDEGLGVELVIGSLFSDSYCATNAVRKLVSEKKQQLDILIICDREGRARIIRSPKYGKRPPVSINMVAQFIRSAEVRFGRKQVRFDAKLFKQEGIVPGIDEWFLFISPGGAAWLLNGGRKNPGAPITKMSLPMLVETVRRAILKQFEVMKMYQDVKKTVDRSSKFSSPTDQAEKVLAEGKKEK